MDNIIFVLTLKLKQLNKFILTSNIILYINTQHSTNNVIYKYRMCIKCIHNNNMGQLKMICRPTVHPISYSYNPVL